MGSGECGVRSERRRRCAAHLIAQEVEDGEALVDRIGAEQRQVGHERRELAAVVVVRRETRRASQRFGLHLFFDQQKLLAP